MKSGKISIAVVCGLIAGILMILLATFLYLGGVQAYMSNIHYLAYVILIILAVIAAQKEKKANNGFLEFRDALKAIFLVFVIGLALYTIFNFILMTYIDPAFRKEVEKAALLEAENFLRWLGASQEKIDEARERAKHQNTVPSISDALLGLAMYYVLFFIVALVIAAIVKRKKPEFDDKAFK
jgi:amino acid transporter